MANDIETNPGDFINSFFTTLNEVTTQQKNEVNVMKKTANDAVKTTLSRDKLMNEQHKDPEIKRLSSLRKLSAFT